MKPPRLVLVLSENHTLVPARDLRALVDVAAEAERAGFDGVMVSEHIVLGRGADADGLPENPRDYALPGNQDPATPWPSSLLLLAAIASVTTRLRLIASAVIPPLRHPLQIAKELATLDLLSRGRLVVQPTVSWHRAEYEALGVAFETRGVRLDEHLEAWKLLWRDSPVELPRSALRVRRRLARAEGVPARRAATVVRRSAPARPAAATAGRVRPRIQPARARERGRPRAPRRGDGCGRPRHRGARDGRRHARLRSPTRATPPRSTERSTRSPSTWNGGSPRSASSRASSPTIRPRSRSSCGASSTASRRALRG